MSTIKVHDKSFEIYLPEAKIQEHVKALAQQINTDYAGKKPLFIAIRYNITCKASSRGRYLINHFQVASEAIIIQSVTYYEFVGYTEPDIIYR